MAFITLSDYAPLTEGNHIFKITKTTYDEQFAKLKINLATKEGATTVKTFAFMKDETTPNEVALNVFSYFARTALQDDDAKEIDPESLVGHYIQATVTKKEVESNKGDGSMVTFFDLNNYKKANGFGDAVQTDNSLAALLGD